MQTNLSLSFLQDKINRLQTALFFNSSESLLSFPTSIIRVLEVDNDGRIWFCMPSPFHAIDEFKKEFFSELQFYRKGENYYLKIVGKASIVNDPEEIAGLECIDQEHKMLVMNGQMMLIKIVIRGADYFETRLRAKNDKLLEMIRQPILHINPSAVIARFIHKRKIFPNLHQVA